ncbi:MAG: beta-glycosidase, partial [Bacteroidetes bacterium]|nr:beta-glycosidase [Bacteroidota bacterium]
TNSWKIVLDESAQWQNDSLYLPPVNISTLPVNIPTGGWEMLENAKKFVRTHLPATVEEYFWGTQGSTFGVTGNYLGVSWFSTIFPVPSSLKGKRIVLHFESVRFRAEVFVNKKLVGYDIVNSTPFDVDITDAVTFGKLNHLAVRITDPNGNFDWRDSRTFQWGEYRTIPSHGFGGITGKVKLIATDPIFIDDVFIKNKPKVHEVDVVVTLKNSGIPSEPGMLTFSLFEWGSKNSKPLLTTTLQVPPFDTQTLITHTLKLEQAKLWSPESPHLYVLNVQWNGSSTKDLYSQRFGFRWFEVRTINGDKQFYLNGKRIVLFTAISWGFWPLNGIAPTDEMAKKQIKAAKELGLNMLNFHRTIGSSNVLDYADELGLLYFEEPGGYQYPYELFTPKNTLEQKQRNFYIPCRREKLFRMIKRDRNHPSLIIYNLHNERAALPSFQDSIDMADAHKLDETRILTYNSCNGEIKMGPDPQFKLHMLPYDSNFYDYGWFDQHHAGGPGVYHNGVYVNPNQYIRYTNKTDEIIYWGEEGAIGTPPRLQLIYNEIQKTGKQRGWETAAYLEWYEAYDTFLKKHGFTSAFRNVDELTCAMGNVAYYYQGRAIENIRINNIADGYAINGWESMMLENHSGIVDNYRNFKGNPRLLSYYLQPLYIAIKIPNKVTASTDTLIADFYIVNQVNLNGTYTLRVTVLDSLGVLAKDDYSVTITGGATYGELILPRYK